MVRVWGRRIRAFGLHPYAIVLLPVLVFLLISMLFWKTSYAGYFVLIAVFQVLNSQISPERMSLLQTCFSRAQQRRILAVESSLWVVPLTLMLLYHRSYIPAILVLLMASLWVLVPPFRVGYLFSFPGWVQKGLSSMQPFEFQIGVRTYFWIIVLGLAGIVMGLVVSNPQITIFSYWVIGFIYVGMHSKTEPIAWVWISHKSAREFVLSKMKDACLHVLLISGVTGLILCMILPQYWWALVLLFLLHIYYVQLTLLIKYSVFPSVLGVAPEIILSLLLIFFPIGIMYSPILFNKSVKQIRWILP